MNQTSTLLARAALHPSGKVVIVVNRTSLQELADLVSEGPDTVSTPRISGTVTELAADSCLVSGLSKFAQIDDIVEFDTPEKALLGQIVRIGKNDVTVKPLTSLQHVRIGTHVSYRGPLSLRPHLSWKGRVLNAFGHPVDGRGRLVQGAQEMQLDNDPPHALERQRVSEPLATGIKVVDVFTPLCRGQRIGVFAGSGLGKSTLLRMLAAAPDFDTVVVALVGERGREVREFLEDGLGAIAERTISVVSTSDESSMMRRLAPSTAVCMAEFFRDQGLDVLLMMDSITRFAHAQRQVGLSVGEPPTTKGYTPSVFSSMAELLERSGTIESKNGTGGSITGLFTILVEGDDMTEPIADAARGILDGHLVLSRRLAHRGHFPAIDVLDSVSRVADQVSDPTHLAARQQLLRLEARYNEIEELLQVGAYTRGVDLETDIAVDRHADIARLLVQSTNDDADFVTSRQHLVMLAGEIEAQLAAATQGPLERKAA